MCLTWRNSRGRIFQEDITQCQDESGRLANAPKDTKYELRRRKLDLESIERLLAFHEVTEESLRCVNRKLEDAAETSELFE